MFIVFSINTAKMTGTDSGENFQCTKCEKSLVGQRYILNSEKPYCIDCYDANFTNTCAACGERITSASKVSIQLLIEANIQAYTLSKAT